jgi:hypothetical protein
MPLAALRVEDGLLHLLRRPRDVEVDGERGFEQALDVVVEEGPAPVVEADALPHAVAQHEAGVVDADRRLALGLQRPVHPDEDLLVPGVFLGGVRADFVHGGPSPRRTLAGRRG